MTIAYACVLLCVYVCEFRDEILFFLGGGEIVKPLKILNLNFSDKREQNSNLLK